MSEIESDTNETNNTEMSSPPPSAPSTDYTRHFDIEVGTTTVTEDATGKTRVMWKAEVTDTTEQYGGGTCEYLGEHPAEAVLGCIEKQSGGVL